MRLRTWSWVLSWFALAACSASPPPSPVNDDSGSSGAFTRRGAGPHLLLTVEISPAGADVLDVQRVDAPLPRSPRVAGPSWRVDVLDGSGATLFSSEIPSPASQRVELTRADGTYARRARDRETFPMALRLPLLEEAKEIRVAVRHAPGTAGTDRARSWTLPYPRTQ